MSQRINQDSGTAFVITHESNPHRQRRYISLIALAVMRSLGRNGVPVVRVHPNRLEYSLESKYCTDVAVSPDMYESESALVDFLLDLAAEYEGKKVLIPASDDCAKFLGEYRSELEAQFIVCAADSAIMKLIVNKRTQYEQAQRLGIPIPETYFPKDYAEVEALAGQITNYPYIIKPLVAHIWRLASMKKISKGRKALLVGSPEELRHAYREMGNDATDVMIQEVIGGRDEQLYTFLSYFGEDGRPLAYCVRSKIRQQPIDFGYCTMTVSCQDDTVVDQSIRLLQGIGYSGISGVEYKYDATTKEYKLIEINGRPVNTIGLAPACGVDIPYIAFLDSIGVPIDPVTTWRNGVTWVRIWFDFFAAREIRRRGGPGLRDWLRSLKGERTEAVIARDDLRPALYYYSDELMRSVYDKLRRTFGLSKTKSAALGNKSRSAS